MSSSETSSRSRSVLIDDACWNPNLGEALQNGNACQEASALTSKTCHSTDTVTAATPILSLKPPDAVTRRSAHTTVARPMVSSLYVVTESKGLHTRALNDKTRDKTRPPRATEDTYKEDGG